MVVLGDTKHGHRSEPSTIKLKNLESILSKPKVHSELTGDRAAAADDDDTAKAYAYLNEFGNAT